MWLIKLSVIIEVLYKMNAMKKKPHTQKNEYNYLLRL